MDGSARRFLIISGLSGAGKTVVLHALEDAGFYCIDNLPVGILLDLARDLSDNNLPHIDDVAVGIDARNHPDAIAGLPVRLDALVGDGIDAELIFVDASEGTLLQRFSETRRRHPLSSEHMTLAEAIEREREILDPIIDRADIRIDTSATNVHELRTTVRELVAKRPRGMLALQFRSFGFKKGVPRDADFVFDVRCLPNPYWNAELRDLTGKDAEVAAFFASDELAAEMIADISGFLDRWIERFEAVNRSYLTIACGCTGGRHRSVYVAEQLAARYAERGKKSALSHRDL